MPVTVSYPGLYIEELPSSGRTIAAAPTSIAVFVGYTHPFKTKAFNKAVQLFSVSDYEREFGGFFASGRVPADVPLAVYNFFLNGGGNAYVVGLQAGPGFTAPSADTNDFRFTAREPTDQTSIKIDVKALTAGSSADITITYGNRPPETYLGVTAATLLDALENSAYVGVTEVASTHGGFVTTTPPLELKDTATAPVTATTHYTDVLKDDSDLDKVPIFNLLVLPGVDKEGVLSAALSFAAKKYAFVIVDCPRESNTDAGTTNYVATLFDNDAKSINGAFYFPYLKSFDPLTGGEIEVAPSGFVAGIYARTDTNRGVWKAPAGLETTILNTTGVVDRGRMTDQRQGLLNPLGINCIRTFPVIGSVVFGARTLVSANTALEPWRYIPVRRTALFIEQTLLRNLGWAVFEPNDEPLWTALRLSVENFMLSLFTRGAFQGSKPSQAFLVRCDSSTTTQTDINLGIVNIVVGFAPLKPAEFVIIKIAQLAGQAQS